MIEAISCMFEALGLVPGTERKNNTNRKEKTGQRDHTMGWRTCLIMWKTLGLISGTV